MFSLDRENKMPNPVIVVERIDLIVLSGYSTHLCNKFSMWKCVAASRIYRSYHSHRSGTRDVLKA